MHKLLINARHADFTRERTHTHTLTDGVATDPPPVTLSLLAPTNPVQVQAQARVQARSFLQTPGCDIAQKQGARVSARGVFGTATLQTPGQNGTM